MQDRYSLPAPTPAKAPAPKPMWPSAIRPFARALEAELPLHIELLAGGLKFRNSEVVFCSPFRVRSRAHSTKSGWSLVIEFLDPLDALVTCILPAETLEKKPRDALGILARHGWRLFSNRDRDTVIDLILNWPVKAFETDVDETGWTIDRAAFALPSGTVLSRKGDTTLYRFTGSRKGVESGNLATWRTELSFLFAGNPNLVFACCAALSAALMPFQATGSQSRIYHFHEKSSVGKSLILRSGMSVWPQSGGGLRTWRTTINGLERAAANANNMALCLDDLPENPGPEFGLAIYMIGNDGGKSRMEQNTEEKERLTWMIIVLSSGEAKSAVALKNTGKKQRGGQDVRMIDIPAVVETDGPVFGAFQDLHGHHNGRAFAKALEKALEGTSGSAGRAFVESLLDLDPDEWPKRLGRDLEDGAATLREALGIADDDPDTTEVQRVLDSFALVMVAGEWATAFGITGWDAGVVTASVTEIAQRWLKDRGSAKSRDLIEGVQSTREFLEGHAHQLVALPARSARPPSEIPGYRDEAYFYILPKTFAEIHAGRTPENIARLLEEAGYLERGGERNSLLFRMRDTGKDRPRAYRIRREIMDA